MRRLIQAAAAQSMVLDALQGETFVIALGASVQSPGMLYVFLLKQNFSGGNSVAWGADIRNGTAADPRPFAVTVQSFIADTGGILKANLPGTWS